MAPDRASEITALLQAHAAGDALALDQLLPRVYQELRRIARNRLRRERVGHTLAATELVHEASRGRVRSPGTVLPRPFGRSRSALVLGLSRLSR